MGRNLIAASIVLSSLLLGACATEDIRSKQTVLDETLLRYAATIRWGDVAAAQAFIDPKVLAEHPPTALELARFKQVQVTGYNEQPPTPVGKDDVRQTVEIGLVNIASQAARSVVDHQVWHYDSATKRWWLMTGLPDISRRE
ncbi:MAG: hypothetical protein ABIW82_13635 [Dokdonella sp.]